MDDDSQPDAPDDLLAPDKPKASRGSKGNRKAQAIRYQARSASRRAIYWHKRYLHLAAAKRQAKAWGTL